MTKKQKYEDLAKNIVDLIGGMDNITFFTHCITRLRINVKDKGLVKNEAILALSGVVGSQWAGEQYQIVIGQDVGRAYDEICEMNDLNTEIQGIFQEDEKQKITPLTLISRFFETLSACMIPLLPVIIAASMFRVALTILGPTMLNLVVEGDDLHTLFTLVGDAGFYFFPIFTGYATAKKFNCSPIMGMFLGAILLHPTLLNIANEGISFTVYGIPANIQNYSSAILPSIISVWLMSYVERFLTKHMPDTLRVVLVPTLTMFIMLPITLCAIAPIGYYLGTFISNSIMGLSEFGGIFAILAIALVGASHQFLVMTGMHHVLMAALIMVISATGQDSVILPGTMACGAAVWGMALGASLRIKNKKEKSLSIGYFITAIVGGVTEPILYGIGMKHKRPFIGMVLGGFVGGALLGIFKVTCYSVYPTANLLLVSMFIGGAEGNFIKGIIALAIGFVTSTAATYFLGFKADDPLLQKQV